MTPQPPLLGVGVTKDGKKKTAIYKLYDYTKGALIKWTTGWQPTQ